MDARQLVGWLLLAFGLLFTLTIFGAILGIPMIIAGGSMLGGGSGNTTQQVTVFNTAPPTPQHRIGDVANGHQLRLASDGQGHWYPMTDEEKRAYRVRQLEHELGIGAPSDGAR